MTQDANDRAGMAGARMLFAYAGGFTVVVLTGAMLEAFGDERRAFLLIGLISGGLASLVFWVCFYICKEPDDARAAAAAAIAGRQPHILTQQYAVFYRAGFHSFDGLRHDIDWQNHFVFFRISTGRPQCRVASADGVCRHRACGYSDLDVHHRQNLQAVCLAGGQFCVGAGFAGAVGQSCAHPRNGDLELRCHQRWHRRFCDHVLGHASRYGGIWRMEKRHSARGNNIRPCHLCPKGRGGVECRAAWFLLDVIGYRAGQVQSTETLDGLRLVIVLVPLVGIAASALCMVFYPLSPQRHADIVRQLGERTRHDKAR